MSLETELRRELNRLDQRRKTVLALLGQDSPASTNDGSTIATRKRKKFSAATLAKMRASQRARWKKKKAAEK